MSACDKLVLLPGADIVQLAFGKFLRKKIIIKHGFKNPVGNNGCIVLVFDKAKHCSSFDIAVRCYIRNRPAVEEEFI